MGHNRTVQRTVVSAAAIQVILLVLLVPDFAATGAAIAYTVSMSGMYMVFSRVAYQELVILTSSSEA
jgi:O-antigen/teichoic acid export membrane protein